MASSDNIELQRHDGHAVPETFNFKSGGGKAEEGIAYTTAVTQETQTGPANDTLQEKWNYPRRNLWRTFAAFFAFIVMGANDGAYGALIPYLQEYYHISYALTSLLFLSPFIGYTSAALSNNSIHIRFGQRGIAFTAPISKLIAYVALCNHPPYPVIVVFVMFAGFGNGLEDSAWNAWIGPMEHSNEVLGFLHGFYGLGALLAPLVATSMITKANLPWYTFYYVMVGASVIEFCTSFPAFFTSTAEVHRANNPLTEAKKDSALQEALFTKPASRVTWLCAFFLCAYVGTEVAVGGWVVTFMLRVRNGAPFASGLTETGFWLGITVGRVVLGFVTGRIGERLAISIYLSLAIACHLCFWLIPSFIASAVFVAFVGFWLAPLFPGAIVAATGLLPKHLHVTAIGFAAAIGGGGAAIFPFAVGAIAQKAGVSVLMPFALGLLIVDLALWLALPKQRKRRGTSASGNVSEEEKSGPLSSLRRSLRRGRSG